MPSCYQFVFGALPLEHPETHHMFVNILICLHVISLFSDGVLSKCFFKHHGNWWRNKFRKWDHVAKPKIVLCVSSPPFPITKLSFVRASASCALGAKISQVSSPPSPVNIVTGAGGGLFPTRQWWNELDQRWNCGAAFHLRNWFPHPSAFSDLYVFYTNWRAGLSLPTCHWVAISSFLFCLRVLTHSCVAVLPDVLSRADWHRSGKPTRYVSDRICLALAASLSLWLRSLPQMLHSSVSASRPVSRLCRLRCR